MRAVCWRWHLHVIAYHAARNGPGHAKTRTLPAKPVPALGVPAQFGPGQEAGNSNLRLGDRPLLPPGAPPTRPSAVTQMGICSERGVKGAARQPNFAFGLGEGQTQTWLMGPDNTFTFFCRWGSQRRGVGAKKLGHSFIGHLLGLAVF